MPCRFGAATMLLLIVPGSGRAQSATVPQHTVTPAVSASRNIILALASTGNQARFIVREQLMSHEMSNDAIGTTSDVSGSLAFNPAGAIDPRGSMFTVGLGSLTSDKENRDSWIKSHTLKTDSFPTARLVVTGIQGLPLPLPTTGTFNLALTGDLTIHGVTRPSQWTVQLTANGDDYAGTAVTHIKFEDFGMEQPRLMIVLSVVDDIRVEYDFHLVKL